MPRTQESEPSVPTTADHGGVIADLIDCERKLMKAMGSVRERLDAELLAARAGGVPHKELAHVLLQRDQRPQTAAELERIARVLRQRTTVAHRRAAARSAGMSRVAGAAPDAHDRPRNNSNSEDTNMERNYLKQRKIIVETYGAPGASPGDELDDVEDMNLAGDDDDLDGDEPVPPVIAGDDRLADEDDDEDCP